MKHIGLARLGRDAEIRHTPAGEPVCNLSLAVSYGQKQADGNRPTQWIDAALWGKRAEVLAPYLLKGSVHCFTLDDLHIETFQGKNGEGTKLVARVLDVELGPRAGDAKPAQQSAPATQQPSQHEQQKANGYQPSVADFDEDIPF